VNSEAILMQADWYVVQTKPRQEFRALEQLQNQHYDCFLPTLQVKRIRRGKLIVDTEPLFSRYLFIRLDNATTDWAPIRSTRGVKNMVAFGGKFSTIPKEYIAALQDAPAFSPQDLFEAGEHVTITNGPFAGWEGLYQLPDGEARALVLVEMMQQPQKLSFALEALRKAS
jgi:transcriptional antiterminator RfaH